MTTGKEVPKTGSTAPFRACSIAKWFCLRLDSAPLAFGRSKICVIAGFGQSAVGLDRTLRLGR